MKRVHLIVLAMLIPIGTVGCASASAKTKPVEVPPLTVPPPPPRAIEMQPPQEPMPEPVPDLPPAPTPSRPARPVREPNREPAKQPPATETKPAEPAAVEPVPQPPAPATPSLRTPQTANDAESANNVKATVERARSFLGMVNFGSLSNERKKAFNDAKAFADQADTALKQSNYAFAQAFADKAEKLARELAGK